MAFARLLLALLLLFAASPGQAASLRPLSVYFLDVGQGDAALVVSPTGKTVLIDAGPPEAQISLVSRVKQLVNGPLDLIILTHPHLDHLGGMSRVIQTVGVRRFMDPGFDHPSDAYRKVLDVVGQEAGQVMTPTPNAATPDAPLSIGLGEGATLSIFWPRVPQEPFLKNTRSDANSNSIVAKLTYGETSFLFTGDAEPETEARLLRQPQDYSATVLKVAHHGGRYSSTAPFLEAVRPQAAVISCGARNDYGHPTREALDRLGQVGARVWRTDRDGEVRAVSDGERVTLTAARGSAAAPVVVRGLGARAVPPVDTPRGTKSGPVEISVEPRGPAPRGEGGRFVSLKGSKVFHREDCAKLKRAKTQERTVYPDRASAMKERRPSEDCKP